MARLLAWLVTLFCISVLTATLHAQASLPSSAAGWWRAETDALDTVRGCTGVVGPGVTFTPGTVGQAFSFDGSSVVRVAHSDDLNFPSSLTIECWVRRQNPDGVDVIVEKGGDWTSPHASYAFSLHNDALGNRIYFTFRGGGRFGGAIDDTNWHHVAVTANHGDTDVTFYVDGLKQEFMTVDGVPQQAPTTVSGRFGGAVVDLTPTGRELHIGASLDPLADYYSRNDIDELTLYGAVLSEAEILAIYNAGAAGKAAPAPPPVPAPAPVPPGLAFWLTGDASGSTVFDETGNNDGQAVGTPLGQSLVGNGLVFNENGDGVIVPHDPSLNPGPTGFTVEFWMSALPNPDDPLISVIDKSHGFVDNTGWVFQGNSSTGNLGWAVLGGGGPPYTNISAAASSTDVVFDGCWHHIAGTWDASDGQMRYYVDGNEYLGSATQNIASNTRDLNVGFAWGGGTPQRHVRGSIDELSIYNRALDTAEIQAIVAAGAGGKNAAVDLPPIADAGMGGNVVVPVGQAIQLDGSGSSDDSPLTFAWAFDDVPLGSGAMLADEATVSPSFVPDVDGDYTVSLVVTDSMGQTDVSQVVLSVVVDDPPVADAGPDASVTVGVAYLLDGLASTDDITAPANLDYVWSIASAPSGSSPVLDFADTESPQFVADLAGAYEIALVVTDERGQISAATPESLVVLTASAPNAAPMADAGSGATVATNSTVQLDGGGSSDPDGDPLTFQWTLTAPNGSTAILVGDTTATPTLTPDIAGTYSVALVVNDGFVDSLPAQATIEAIAANVFIQDQIREVQDLVASLPASSFFAGGGSNPTRQARRAERSRRTVLRLLRRAARDAQQLTEAIAANDLDGIEREQRQLQRSLARTLVRTDGVALRGVPDVRGSGFRLDRIVDPVASTTAYIELTLALESVPSS